MKTKMNRMLSLLLSLALIISLLPVMPAFATGVEQKLEISEIIAKNTSSASESVELAGSALSWQGIQVRRYSSGGTSTHRQFVALKVNVATPGKYNVYFKTNNPTEISIAPAIAIVKYNSAMDSAKNTNAIIETNDNLLGYFNFSAATAGEYAPVTKDGSTDGEKITVELESGD